MKHVSLKAGFLLSCVGLASWAQAASPAALNQPVAEHNQKRDHSIRASQDNLQPNPFRIFKPQAKTSSARINYEVWDLALEKVVLRMGQSLRIRARRPDPMTGTRRITGHKSAYRLEGSRVTFSLLNDEYRDGLSNYRKDLEHIASTVDITRLDRKEQLAFWLNLHNVTLIEQIALHYPVKQPHKLRVGPNNEVLDEAKILKIRGLDISLRDIRENIVYPNWDNPDVMYGFFRGNIGGPALQNYAFTGSNVDYILELQAHDFVNSLRGFHEANKALNVSSLYDDVRPFYFKSWPSDLKVHLRKHASPDVLEELAVNKPIQFDRYDAVVADLNAGSYQMTPSLSFAFKNGVGVSPATQRLLGELYRKTIIMQRRGMIVNRSGKVTIEDVPTIDIDLPNSTHSPED